ncbi:MBL fold metallo-hydrolase [Cellulomonas fengjieae]|uniref:MBL fold metallo-hydrolase n=1 Tax=Cellulomonas fengjieae TaxID=2819978 RepID=A0ABS3SIS8_9CELL|nr:MBL fold metallo-hydrolase [Cellulomonas fengjieae]MBO3085659.1 MBL fold metallo-hydrolase [Cellulomonas fengjieae]QVI67626.1 MBL fold metallo-hydrolase [Cellulomonas fengjieae]
MITTEVADRVYRLGHAFVSCYLVEEDGRLLLVDAGLPAMWPQLAGALREHGRRPQDIAALVLTHAHFDHTGVAARVQAELGLPVWAHPDDFALAEHPYRYAHENPRALYPIRHPRAVRILAAMARAGALRVPGVSGLRALPPTGALDLPGSPVVVPTPGHTYGHCALHLPGRDTVLSGDALVTLDPYTAVPGPQIVAGAATADSEQALASLDALAATGASTVLPGHGEPWTAGVQRAVEEARARGAH